MLSRKTLAVASLILSLLPGYAAASGTGSGGADSFAELARLSHLPAGTRIRVTFRDPVTDRVHRQSGALVSITPQALEFEADGQRTQVPAGAVLELERRRSNVAQSAVIGAIGTAAVALVSARDGWARPVGPLAAMGGAVVGGLIGALVGTAVPRHQTDFERDTSVRSDVRFRTGGPAPDQTRADQQTDVFAGRRSFIAPAAVPGRRWWLSGYGGNLSGSGSAQLTAALVRQGLGDFAPADESSFGHAGGAEHPHGDRGPVPWMLEAGFAIRPRLAVSAMFANSRLGTMSGYSGETGELTFGRDIRSYAALISYAPLERVRIGVGPALHSLRVQRSSEALGSLQESGTRRVGAVIDTTIDVVRTRRVMLSLKGQYRIAGSASTDSLAVGFAGIPHGVAFGFTDLPFNHLFLGFGLSVRF